MDIKKFLVPLLLISSLSGCGNKSKDTRVLLSYGSLTDTEATQISYADLKNKVDNEESFLLALRPGKESDITCSCWKTFKSNIDSYVKNNKIIWYEINVYNVSDEEDNFGIKAPSSQDPGFALFKNGSLVKQYYYTSKNTPIYWSNADALTSYLNEIVIEPKNIYISVSDLDKKISNNDSFIITYVWKSCSDCAYCLPNVFDPYVKSHNLEEDLFLLECEIEGLLLVDGVKNSSNENYKAFLTAHGVSEAGNEKFGYSPISDNERGYVPTTQYYKNGTLYDADTFFNDTISKKEDGTYYVSRSFFSESRKQYLHYVNDVETNVLEGLELKEEEVGVYGEYIYWINTFSSKYHVPLLNAFLDTYAK